MKAVAVFPKSREVRVIDVPEPRLRAPTGVRVRTLEVGVCGTDQEIAEFRHGAPPEGEDFLIVGHEALGEVVEVGAQVKGLKPGDLVVPRVRRPCPHEACPACRSGNPDFCVTGDYLERGIQKAHGFCVEFFVEEEASLHPVPSSLRGVAVLTEPLTIAEKALRELDTLKRRLPWKGKPGQAVVLGAGPVGLLGAMAFLRAGHATTVYSRSPKPNPKAAVAEAVGAPYLSSKEVPAEALARRLGAVDVVYEASGAAKAGFEVLKVLGPNGVFIFTGVPGRKEPLELEGAALLKQLVLKNQLVLGTVNASAGDFQAALEDLGHFQKRWPGQLEALLTERHPPEAFHEVVTGKAGGIKHLIRFA
ncbi:glucose 1-dehydrogenase [Stigmatella aurantiaca]|uniref:Glucose 1-dehydrogenase n=1 Tax=Stigmatella aurantiaca (strain DW4/3-1) TaxID=378806 RepID=Q09D01_STIAD|nr:glucose 1-dehydrogenase [Stigmatella aurantiaca]ADO67914.1 Glucose 1-dehydrogenase [Stigmatella aurantiaca DW4/3-1]EAU69623.1 glucose dehydrogenase Gcd [Stigmatella aurantiaca DW4/3-1]